MVTDRIEALRQAGRRVILAAAILAALVAAASVPARAQTPVSQLNPEQMKGRRLFMQNCSLCHLPRPDNVKSTEEGKAYGGDLKQVFKGPQPMSDQAVAAFIQRGLPKKMPGFQYGLKREEISNIISYLKTL